MTINNQEPVDKLFSQAVQSVKDGNMRKALRECQQIVLINPLHNDAFFLSAYIFEVNNDFEKAVVMLESMLKNRPSNDIAVRVRNNLALDYYELGQSEKAIQSCLAGLQIENNCFELNNSLALIYNRQNNFGKGLPYAQKACDLNPNDSGAQGNLGESCFACGLFKESAKAFETALKYMPANEMQGRGAICKQKLEIAIKYIESNANPSNGNCLNNENSDFLHGCELFKQGKLEESLKNFNKQRFSPRSNKLIFARQPCVY